MVAAAILNFGKNVNNTGLDCTKVDGKMRHGHAEMTIDHMNKSWNRKLIRVTSSKEHLVHKYVDLRAYKSSQQTDHQYQPIRNSLVRVIV